jgi:membrane protease YdiL (CAAX protease family)/uncharacterized RDD family membrane protein YckC
VTPAYASVGRRIAAASIDMGAWFFVALMLFGQIPSDAGEGFIGLYAIVVFSLWFNYFPFCEARWGQTVGKTILGLFVAGEDGRRPGWGPASLRNLLRLVDLPFTLIGIGAFVWSKEPRKRRLGDRAAHTVVTRTRPAPLAEQAPPPEQEREVQKPAEKGPKRIGLPEGTWRPKHVLWGILALLGLSVVEALLVAPFDPDLSTLAGKLVAQALLALTLIAVAFGFAAMPGSGLVAPEKLGLRAFKPSDLKWAAAAIGIYILFAAIYAPLVQPHQEDVARDLGFGSSVFGAVAAAVLIIIVAPVSEEIFFRGFVFGGMRHRLSLWPAAIVAGAIFGVFHFTGADSWGVIPQLAMLGFLLCWLYEKTGSIWPTIMVHMLNNLLAFIVIATS